MKINCLHGYFIFEEQRAGEASDFTSLFGLVLEQRPAGGFTFADLSAAPDFSISGSDYLTGVSTKTFAGEPWEIFEANEFVYNYDIGLIVPIASIKSLLTLNAAGNFFVSPGLILPGSLTDSGDRVKDYAAWFSVDTMKFKFSEVTYV